MYNKHNLAISKVASKSFIKPALSCVAFYGNRNIATDSFRVIEMSADGDKHDIILHQATIVSVKKLKKNEKCTREELNAQEIKDTYPDIDTVMDAQFSNKEKEYVSLKINGVYLAEVCKLLSDLSPFATITLEIEKTGNVQNAIRITSHNGNNRGQDVTQTARALVMPHSKQ